MVRDRCAVLSFRRLAHNVAFTPTKSKLQPRQSGKQTTDADRIMVPCRTPQRSITVTDTPNIKDVAMIDLYSLTSLNVQKIYIILEETNLPYNEHFLDVWKGDQFEPDSLDQSERKDSRDRRPGRARRQAVHGVRVRRDPNRLPKKPESSYQRTR